VLLELYTLQQFTISTVHKYIIFELEIMSRLEMSKLKMSTVEMFRLEKFGLGMSRLDWKCPQ